MCSWHELEESADYGKFLFYIPKLLERKMVIYKLSFSPLDFPKPFKREYDPNVPSRGSKGDDDFCFTNNNPYQLDT